MSSTGSSDTSSAAPKRRADHLAVPYRGPEYRQALESGAPLDPLVHPDPQQPPRSYRWLVALLAWLLPRLFRIEIEGREHIPPPPYVIACNHQRWFDPLFVAIAFPRVPMIYSMAKRETVFNRAWKRWIVPLLGVFPISPDRGELDAAGVNTVYQLLDRGAAILMFPEGRYSRGRALRPLKKGVGHFALQAGVPICPVAIEGLDRLRFLGKVRISIGRPVFPDPPAWWAASRQVARVVESVRRSILQAFVRTPKAPARGRLRRLGAWIRGDERSGEAREAAPP